MTQATDTPEKSTTSSITSLDEAQNEIQGFSSNIQNFLAAIEDERAQLQKDATRSQDLENQLLSSTEKLESLSQELEQQRLQSSVTSNALSELEETSKRQRDEIASKRDALLKTRKELNEALERLSSLQEKIETLQAQRDEAERNRDFFSETATRSLVKARSRVSRDQGFPARIRGEAERYRSRACGKPDEAARASANTERYSVGAS